MSTNNDGAFVALVNRIAEMAIANAGINEMEQVVALPASMQLHDLEKYHPHPRHFKGVFQTPLMTEFAAYCSRYTPESVFIAPDDLSAWAWFDLGGPEHPGHGLHRAKCDIQPTAAFAAWTKVCSARLTQRDLREWIGDWGAYVDDGDVLYRSVATVTVDNVRQMTSTSAHLASKRTALESVDIRSAAAQLPEVVTFTCEPYPGFDEGKFTARLSADATDGELSFRLVRTRAMAEAERLALEFQQHVMALLDGATLPETVLIGTFEQ